MDIVPKYKLTKVGVKQFSGIVEARDEWELLKIVKQYCVSRFPEIWWDDEGKKGHVIVGMGRSVGRVEEL